MISNILQILGLQPWIFFSSSRGQFFLIVDQNNSGNKIPLWIVDYCSHSFQNWIFKPFFLQIYVFLWKPGYVSLQLCRTYWPFLFWIVPIRTFLPAVLMKFFSLGFVNQNNSQNVLRVILYIVLTLNLKCFLIYLCRPYRIEFVWDYSFRYHIETTLR